MCFFSFIDRVGLAFHFLVLFEKKIKFICFVRQKLNISVFSIKTITIYYIGDGQNCQHLRYAVFYDFVDI